MTKGANGLTYRQERFCRAFVRYGNAATAAFEAGYAPRWTAQHGYRLLQHSRIRARIAEIQAGMAHDACRDMDVLLGKLENVYRRALEDHNFHAAVRAVDIQAKLRAARRAEEHFAAKADAQTDAPAKVEATVETTSAPTAQGADSKPETRKMYSFG